jgi:hypothetical protein
VKRPQFTVVTPDGDEIGPRYGGARGYEDADEWRKANDIAHPRAQVVEAPLRLPRRGGR